MLFFNETCEIYPYYIDTGQKNRLSKTTCELVHSVLFFVKEKSNISRALDTGCGLRVAGYELRVTGYGLLNVDRFPFPCAAGGCISKLGAGYWLHPVPSIICFHEFRYAETQAAFIIQSAGTADFGTATTTAARSFFK